MFDDDDFLNSDEVEQLDYDTYSQTSRKDNSYKRGKQQGKNLRENIKNIKENSEDIKSGISDIKSGNVKDGINKIYDSTHTPSKNAIERTGSNIKNTGKGMKEASEGLENAGKGMKKANEIGENVSKGVKKGAQVSKNAGKALSEKGKMDEAVAQTTKAASDTTGAVGDTINAAGAAADATGVGAIAGVPMNVVGTTLSTAGKVGHVVSTAGQVGAKGEQVIGKSQQVASQGVENAAKASELGNKLGKKFGDGLEKVGKTGKELGDKVEKAGQKVEDTGKELGNIIKPFTGTLDLLKKLPKILAIAAIIAFFIGITYSYYDIVSPISETSEMFNNLLNSGSVGYSSTGLYYSVNGENNNNKKFYDELNKWYEKSNGQLDVPLALSTLYYTDITAKNSDFSIDDSDENDDNTDIDSITNDEASLFSKGKIKRLRKICKNMLDSKNNPVSDDDFKEFLRNKYINKQSEFKQFLSGLDEDAKKEKIESIISEIYQYREYYVQVFGDGKTAGNSENYQNACVGAIDSTLVSDLHLPIDSKGTINFDESTSYGLVDGQVHNGVDLNQTTASVSTGDKVYSIHDGTVVDVGTDGETNETFSEDESTTINNEEDSNTEEDNNTNSDSGETTTNNETKKDFGGIWVKIKHEVMVNDKKYTFYSLYKHLSYDVKVKKDDKVEKGQEIGYIGKEDEGGAQLHFEFRNENDTPIDPTNLFIKCVSGNGELVGNDDEERIWNHFIGAGYTKASTAAAMGNMMAESGLVSYRVQGDFSDGYTRSIEYTAKVNNGTISEYDFIHNGPGGGGYGLIQWTSYDRKQELYNRTMKNGLNIDDLKTQLEYEHYELGLTGSAGWLSYTNKKLQWESATDSTVKSAAIAYCEGFERPAAGNCNSTRENNAQYIYDKYKNYVAPAVNLADMGKGVMTGNPGTENSDNTGDGYPNGTYTSTINGNQFKKYKQYLGSYEGNSYWGGTMHSSGCGPTSVAILASGLVDFNITPAETAADMNSTYGYTGSGPLSGEMEKLGMSAQIISGPSADDITNALYNGKVMLVSVDSRTIFTNNSHIMAIIDINSAGQVYVMNPGGNIDGWYDIYEIMKGCNYIITTPAK